MSTTIADMLDDLDLFHEFDYPELEIIARYLLLQEVNKGDIIFREGDPGSYMFILLSGRIAVFKGGEMGQHLLSYEGRGRIVGEMALLDRERRSATCAADTDCQFLTLSSESLTQLAEHKPALAYHFMFCLARMLSQRLRRTSGLMAEFLGS
ncbi:MAG TPA: cyclic nucleotide-binding domain-containing protein [Burkholderiaceae bacterium]